MKALLGKTTFLTNRGLGRRVTVTAFGKAAFKRDFLDPLGFETELLIRTRHAFIEGLEGANKQWQIWEHGDTETPAAPEKLLSGYDHCFLWARSDRLLFGLIWSSTDQVNRRDPLVLCAEIPGVSLGFALGQVRPVLEGLKRPLQSATDLGQVTNLCQQAQQKLTALLGSLNNGGATSRDSDLEARRLFLDRPEFGPNRQGWLRILHEMRPVLRGAPDAKLKVTHVRVPLGTASRNESLRLWAEFLLTAVTTGSPIWLISRNDCAWLDVIVGEPTPRLMSCLQATTRGVPLATETAYEVGPELPKQLSRVEACWLEAHTGHSVRRLMLGAIILCLGAVVGVVFVMPRPAVSNSGEREHAHLSPTATNRQVEAAQADQDLTARTGRLASTITATTVTTKAVSPPTNMLSLAVVSNAPGVSSPQVVSNASGPPPTNPELDKALKAAQEAEKVGNITNALALYWAAQKLNPTDVGLVEHIKELTPKAQEQTRLAEQQARLQQIADNEFRKTMDSAVAAAGAGDYSNALAAYQGALKIKDDPEARAGIAKTQQQIQEASDRVAKEEQARKQFQDTLAVAKKAEDAKDLPGALVAYRAAQTIRKDDSQVAERIKALTQQIEDQKRAEAARMESEQAEARRFATLVAAGKDLEKAGNFTNALTSYQEAKKLKPTDQEMAARIQDLTPKAEQQARQATETNKESRLRVLDAELESLMVRFGLVKAEQAKTESGRKARVVSGTLSMKDLNSYLAAVDKMEAEYKANGWLNKDQRAEKIKKLIDTIQNRN